MQPTDSPRCERDGTYQTAKATNLDPDRDIDCQQAVESGFQQLMQKVASAGWRRTEIAEAIEHLVMADRRAREENAKLDTTLHIAKAMATGHDAGYARPLGIIPDDPGRIVHRRIKHLHPVVARKRVLDAQDFGHPLRVCRCNGGWCFDTSANSHN